MNIFDLKRMKNLCIFNSFYYHYEMFGYIINFCKVKNYNLVIYTNFDHDLNFLEFYKKHFVNFNFILKHVSLFENEYEKENYDLIIVTTSNDPLFKKEWINNKVLFIEHNEHILVPQALKKISIRKYNNNLLWALPIYPIKNFYDNKEIKDSINIIILGQLKKSVSYNIKILNRLKSNKKIVIHAISRFYICELFNDLRNDIEINYHISLNTFRMIELLLNSDYLITDIKLGTDETFYMSGAVPLSFNCLLPLIISSQNNKKYMFKNVIEYDREGDEPIILKDIDIKLLEQERNELLEMVYTNLDKFF